MQRVFDVMTRDVYAVAPDTSLETAARLLAQRRITGAPVISSGRHVTGMVSASDLADPDCDTAESLGYPLYYRVVDGLAHELGDHVGVRPGRVQEVMTQAVISIPGDASIVEAAERMLELGAHRLLVVHGNDELVGLVSSIDLLRAFVQMHQQDSDRVSPAANGPLTT